MRYRADSYHRFGRRIAKDGMGLTRKIISVGSLGTVARYRSRDERMERYAKQTKKAAKAQQKLMKKALKNGQPPHPHY